jgi:hypothetical protein
MECRICVFFMYLSVGRANAVHAPAHDEFNGAPKVSPIRRAVMTTAFDRLRRTAATLAAETLAAATLAISLCAMSLIAGASNATAAKDASRWDGDTRKPA